MTNHLKWLPLESNPAVFANYVKLIEGPDDLEFTDVCALEDWAFEWIPKPVLALLFVFPLTSPMRGRYKELETANPADISNVWFTRQTIPNACGTIALLHTLMNLPPQDPGYEQHEQGKYLFDRDGALGVLSRKLADRAPHERAAFMETDETLGSVHQRVETQGNTRPPAGADTDVIEHFVAFIRKQNRLYELDGRLQGPVDHGPTSRDTFLADVKPVILKIMEWDTQSHNFSILAVSEKSPSPENEKSSCPN